VTHDEIVKEIQARAQRAGILTHYCGRSERCAGDAGQPDLILIGRQSVAWVEVKTPGADPSPAQIRWKYALKAAGEIWEVMREEDLAPAGAVNALLEFITRGTML
jgi:VRR-NUC domain-containing protein